MKSQKILLKPIALWLLMFIANGKLVAQDSIKINLDSFLNTDVVDFLANISILDYSVIYHNPSTVDSLMVSQYENLVQSEPTIANYMKYYDVACALWNIGRIADAEKMFLKILNSDAPYFNKTYFHSSDTKSAIDSVPENYASGCFTSSYKNGACRYLAKINIENEQFDKGLNYATLADKTYSIFYSCGTGHLFYRDEIDVLYILCYEGLHMYDTIINIFLPRVSNFNNKILVSAIQKKYSQNEIQSYLEIGVDELVLSIDSHKTSIYTLDSTVTETELKIESSFITGSITTRLFGVDVFIAHPHLKDGEVITEQIAKDVLTDSWLYQALATHSFNPT